MYDNPALLQEKPITRETSAPRKIEFVMKPEETPMEVEEEEVVPKVTDRPEVNKYLSNNTKPSIWTLKIY